jgi:hypothetical protein
MVDADTVLRKSAKQVSCNLDNEVAILDLDAACYFGLNEVGAFIWQLLDEPRTVRGICESVVEEFSVDETTCRADVARFLSSLQQAGLIEGHL